LSHFISIQQACLYLSATIGISAARYAIYTRASIRERAACRLAKRHICLHFRCQTASAQMFDQLLPEALFKGTDAKPDWKFDTIAVGEGQDFKDDGFNTQRVILRDPDTSDFYVFHVDNHRIFTAKGHWSVIRFNDARDPAVF
jgi:hypothetical protein